MVVWPKIEVSMFEELNVESLEAAMEEVKAATKPREPSRWWYPKERNKEYTFRIIPFPGTGGDLFLKRKIYKNIQGYRSIPAPYESGKPDPVQDAIEEFRAKRDGAPDEKVKEYNRVLSSLYPRDEYLVMGLDRAEETPMLKFWSVSRDVLTILSDLARSEDYTAIFSPNAGHDLRIKRLEGAGKATVSITPRPKATPLLPSKAAMEALGAEIPDINEVQPPPDYDTLQRWLSEWLKAGSPKAGDRTPAAAPVEAVDEGKLKSETAAALDDAFPF